MKIYAMWCMPQEIMQGFGGQMKVGWCDYMKLNMEMKERENSRLKVKKGKILD